jgi:hypothetical protein
MVPLLIRDLDFVRKIIDIEVDNGQYQSNELRKNFISPLQHNKRGHR